MLVLSTRIVLDCFYLLIFYSDKFSTDVRRLPYAVNVNLNLSIYRQPLSSYQTVASRCLPEQSFHGVIKTFILLFGKNKLELLAFSLYSEMFNRRAAALKPSLFSKGVFVIFLHPPPPPFPTSKHSWNLNSQIFVCVL